MNVILWILFGALVGWIASLIIGHVSVRQAELMTIVGVIAGIIGGWVANIIGNGSVNSFNIYSIMAAICISIMSILVYDNLFLTRHK